MKNAAHDRTRLFSPALFLPTFWERRKRGGSRCGFPKHSFRFCVPLLAAVAFAPSPVFAGVNRWTSNGPFGVSARSLAVDPMNPDRVYAGTEHGVFSSRDGGLSWSSSLSVPSSGLAIDPLSPSNVYAATNSGVFKSVDAGGRWTAAGPGLTAYSVAIDPVTPSTVVVGTAGGLFKSTDGGARWSGRLLSASIYSLAFSSQAPSTIFGADFDNSASYYYYPSPSRLFKSNDQGATWSDTDTGISIFPGALAIDPTNPSILYAGSLMCCGVYKSVDSGSTWNRLGTPFLTVTAVVIDPRNPRTLYASTLDDGWVFRSTNGGVSWGVFGDPSLRLFAYSLAIDQTGTRLYAGTANGFVGTPNGGVFAYQIYSGAALDLSVDTDNTARLLFTDLDNRVAFRSFDTSGNSTSDASYGPYAGWSARAVADGLDGLTRVLWNNLDSTAALWLLGPTGNPASYRYGPAAGWTAVDVSVGPDNTTHILWTSTDGRTGLLSVDVSGAILRRETFGPYSGWLARSISDGADGLTRVLWNNTDGRVGLSLIGAGGLVAAHRFAGASGWTAQDVAVASDNQTRILRVNDDGRMALWSVDNSGTVTDSETVYEPPASGQTATRISAGTDGLTRVLWTSPEGTGTLWLMGLDNIRQSSFGFN